jgi:hypothetical protein
MSRWKAAGLHLLTSVIVAALVGSLIYFVWYPPPYFRIAGGSTLMPLIMGVDVIIGPFLTLAVFKSGKKGLKFDLTVIAVLQVAAFCYGMHTIAVARPVFVVAETDRFVLVAGNQLDDKDLADAKQVEFSTRSWTGPRLVGVHLPKSGADALAMAMSGMAGKDVEKFPKYYLPYSQVAEEVMTHTHPLSSLVSKQPARASQIDGFVARHGGKMQDFVYLPLEGRLQSFTMVLSTQTRQPVAALAIDPWQPED